MATKCKVTGEKHSHDSRMNSDQTKLQGRTKKKTVQPDRKSRHTCSFAEPIYKLVTLRSGVLFGEQGGKEPLIAG